MVFSLSSLSRLDEIFACVDNVLLVGWFVFSLQCMRLHLHDSAIFMQRSRSIPSICSYVLHDGRNKANIKKKVKCGSLMFVLNI